MHNLSVKSLIAALMVFLTGAAGLAQTSSSNDPREMGLDLYLTVTRESPPEAVAFRLGELIELYRYRCARVTDYQLFLTRPNLIDLKVKCSGDPLYGLTVGSNGYVAVFGGNGMVAGLDRRDALIYSFGPDGKLEGDSSLDVRTAVNESVVRMQLGDEYNTTYLGMMVLTALGILVGGLLVWVRAWRHRRDNTLIHTMPVGVSSRNMGRSSLKDQLIAESEQVAPWVYKHPSGVYLAQGKRGKRRLFHHQIWARVYALIGWKLFESNLDEMHAELHGTSGE